MGTYTSGATLEFIDGNGKGCAQYRSVVLHLMRQVEFLAPFDGDRGTEHTTCVLQHEVYFLGSNLLGCDNQVAFILAVFVVYYDDKLTVLEIFYGFLYGIKFCFFHHCVIPYYIY